MSQRNSHHQTNPQTNESGRHMRRLISNLSAEFEHIRRLLALKAAWSTTQQNLFIKVCFLLSAAENPTDKSVTIQTDASTCGLAAGLIQENKPVAYILRKQTQKSAKRHSS